MLEILLSLLNEVLADRLDAPLGEGDTGLLLSDVGFDSLTFISFVLLLEEKLDIELLDSDLQLENFVTVKCMLETLKNYETE